MMPEKSKKALEQTIIRMVIMLAISFSVGLLAHTFKLNKQQIISSSIFVMIVMATLLFWKFRLAIAFIGIGVLMGTNTLDLPTFIKECKIDVILFLVGMMITVGVLRELGLFTWIIQSVIKTPRMTGKMFIIIVMFLSAMMSCIVDEVTSIIFMATLVFQVCDTLKISPMPFLIISVMATNIGSSGTMLGNPVGIVIGQNVSPPLSFVDFIVWSFPVMIITLSISMVLLLWWYRREIHLLSERLSARRQMGLGLGPLVNVPYKRGLAILLGMISFIALHRWLEIKLGLAPNTILIVAPLVIAGILMVFRQERARHYIEADVEWWTLLFFMMLFAVAGSLQHTHVTEEIAGHFQNVFGDKPTLLMPIIIAISAAGSALVDNVVFVAAFVPVVDKLEQTPLVWALLQGACLGGNITMIGSTANIVALGMAEKRYRASIKFFEWLKVGLVVGVVSCLISWASLSFLADRMPTRQQRLEQAAKHIKTQHISNTADNSKIHNIVEPNKP
ncbi:MAG: anion permease [Planctomycetes bacterium]|nr:anion permease [Planctomycetota bacterium]MBU1518942.1 anion permease [Planctomycetota bacterium]MBU2457945.1 anion permease [Planctomycetota bacterium]MBU2597106.1 anion permease [Planctomycetota bacterium]